MSNYSEVGDQFASTILDIGLASDGSHIIANYGSNDSTWITTYPFAVDKLLDTQTFNESTYALQSEMVRRAIEQLLYAILLRRTIYGWGSDGLGSIHFLRLRPD